MNTVVNTQYGPVSGFYRDNLMMWFGIPYAAPPVGEKGKAAREMG